MPNPSIPLYTTRVRRRKPTTRPDFPLSPRVCSTCRFAFISRYGYNICSDCFRDLYLEYSDLYALGFRHNSPYKAKSRMVRGWAEREGRMPKRTKNPHYPIPDISSPHVQSSLANTFRLMQESLDKGVFITDSMPRLDPPLRYPNAPRSNYFIGKEESYRRWKIWRKEWRRKRKEKGLPCV